MKPVLTWIEPYEGVCQDWKGELVATWGLKDDTYAYIFIKQCQLHVLFPRCCMSGIWHRNPTFTQCIWRCNSFLIPTVEVSQLPLLSGNMVVFMFSVTFRQEMENSFNYQTHPSFIGSALRHQLLSWNHFNMFSLATKSTNGLVLLFGIDECI